MKKISKGEYRKTEIMRLAVKKFLETGYSQTRISSISKQLKISPGHLTFYYPAKEDLLAELVELLCDFQQKMFETVINDGYSSIMAICLELAAMASMCEYDEIIKDFYISTYCSPKCLEIIRKHDTERAKIVFEATCLNWTHEDYKEAEILVSGIEYSTLLNSNTDVSLEKRISGALNTILSIYNVPEELRKTKIDKVLAMDYHKIGHRILNEFKDYVDHESFQLLKNLSTRRKEHETNIR